MSSFNQRGCFGCGGLLDGLLCRQCTCEWCGNNLRNGFCPICDSGAGNSFVYDPHQNSFNDPGNFFNHPPQPQFESYSCELCGNDSDYGCDCPPRLLLERTIPLNEIISQLPPSIAITIPLLVLPTVEPEDSLIMGDENLSTIPEKESDEVIKSSVEDLVPILSESEDTSENDSEYDLPFCGNSVTFSNPLFDSNDDFSSSNDESLPEEDVPEENFKIYSNPLFKFVEEYISSDINPFFSEVLEDIESKDSYVSNLDDQALLVTDLFDANEDECFDPGGDIDEIDTDVSTDIEDGYHDSEGDIIYLESLLINDTIPNLPLEVFLDHDPKSLNDEPNINDLKIKENVRFTFEDRHYISLTFVIKIFLPFLTYPVNSLLLLSSGSEDTIFDPDISFFSFYSLEPVVSHRSGTFMIAPDYEDSRARGFVHRSLKL
ncbi:hypothetical protein Tco_0707000 [Tanacetum coccineum]|uniref:Pre-mRNA splicing Prp18-interacting factor n=1 Tax=Tanacetum coccineum TaxID=301880 RepID=A0ABQ4Y8Z7_9ASTR